MASAQAQVQFQNQMRAHTFEFRERLASASERAMNDLQLTEITTVSHIEANFNELIFEVERCKKLAVEAARLHFSASHKRLETIRGETERLLKRQTAGGGDHADFMQLDATIKMAIAALNTFAVENRFNYEFDKLRSEQIKCFFRRRNGVAPSLDEPNLLNMSIDNDEFASIMGNSKANSVVFDQRSRETNILTDKPLKASVRKTASSTKKRPEERFETNSLYSNKPDRNSSQFQSVYVGAAKAYVERKILSNKENVSEKKKGQGTGTDTPQFVEVKLENRLAERLKSPHLDETGRLDPSCKNELSFTERVPTKPKSGPVQSFKVIEPPPTDRELNLAGKELTPHEILQTIAAEARTGRVSCINISGNHIEDKGLRHLLKSLTKLHFESLCCQQTGVTEVALDYFISFRKYNQRLSKIDLRGNGLKEESASVAKKVKMLKDMSVEVSL